MSYALSRWLRRVAPFRIRPYPNAISDEMLLVLQTLSKGRILARHQSERREWYTTSNMNGRYQTSVEIRAEEVAVLLDRGVLEVKKLNSRYAHWGWYQITEIGREYLQTR